MSVSTGTRFEVFKRDDFTCQYCGRKTPDVVLEVDHIVPRSQGGPDELTNLITACWDCNRGKGAKSLDDRAPGIDFEGEAARLNEREKQFSEYQDALRAKRERENERIEEIWAYWEALGDLLKARARPPDESVARMWVNLFTVQEIKDAMDIASERRGTWTTGVKYLAGILRNWKKDRGGGGVE